MRSLLTCMSPGGGELDSPSAVVASGRSLGLFGSARDEVFDRVHGEFASLACLLGRPLIVRRWPAGASTGFDVLRMGCSQRIGVDIDGSVCFRDELLPCLLELLDVQVLVGAGEVEVDL